MNSYYGHNTKLLWGLVVLTMLYSCLSYLLPTLTGVRSLDGSIGVILGLYTCSRPAANAVDMLFFERRLTWNHSMLLWLALNLLVFGLGCLVIVSGTIRLVG